MIAQPDKVIPKDEPLLPIRQQIGLILHRVISQNGLKKVFHDLSIQGFINDRIRDELIILLCQRVEKLENDRSNTTRKV